MRDCLLLSRIQFKHKEREREGEKHFLYCWALISLSKVLSWREIHQMVYFGCPPSRGDLSLLRKREINKYCVPFYILVLNMIWCQVSYKAMKNGAPWFWTCFTAAAAGNSDTLIRHVAGSFLKGKMGRSNWLLVLDWKFAQMWDWLAKLMKCI